MKRRIIAYKNYFFFCFDEGRVVVLFNCFQKKSQKTPQREINLALKLKAEYEERKKHGDF